MKQVIFGLLAALALAGTAYAGDTSVGVQAGVTGTRGMDVGVNAQYALTDNLVAEATYDRVLTEVSNPFVNDTLAADAVSLNGLLQVSAGRFTPYALAGVGYRFNAVGADEATWTVGAGAEYALTDRFSLDGRYRRTEGFDTKGAQDAFTLGFRVKF